MDRAFRWDMRVSTLACFSTLALGTLGLPATSRAASCDTCSGDYFCSGIEFESKTIVEGDVVLSNDLSIEVRVDIVHLIGSAPVAAGDVVATRSKGSRYAEKFEVGSRVVARVDEGSDVLLALTSSDRVVCTGEPTSTIPLALYIAQHENGDRQRCDDAVRSDPGYREVPCDVGLYCSATAGTVPSRIGAWLPVTVVFAFMLLLGRRRTSTSSGRD